MPTQSRRDPTFSRVTGCGGSSGPSVEARWMLEIKPAFCSASATVRVRLVEGIEVWPNRARDAFWRCEHTWESVTRDIVGEGVDGNLTGQGLESFGRPCPFYTAEITVADVRRKGKIVK